MTAETIMQVFQEPHKAIKDSGLPPWKPYTRGVGIKETIPSSSKNPYNSNKRGRQQVSEKVVSPRTGIVANTSHNYSNHTNSNQQSLNVSYLRAATMSTQPTPKKDLHPSSKSTACVTSPNNTEEDEWVPHRGLRGGIEPNQSIESEKIMKLESELIALKNMMEENYKTVSTMDEKIEKSNKKLILQMENKMEANNQKLENKFSSELRQNNIDTSNYLRSGLQELMNKQFTPLHEYNRMNDENNKKALLNQEAINTKLTNSINSILETDKGPSIIKNIKAGRYISRTSVAKNLLHAKKTTNQQKLIRNQKSNTTSNTNKENISTNEKIQNTTDMDYNSDFDDEIIDFEDEETQDNDNQQEAAAISGKEQK
jgi:hypothetical protein